jgi:structural maintenance of chromosome 1
MLYKLYHIEQAMETNSREIKEQSKALNGLRREQEQQEADLAEARAQQATAKSAVMQQEKKDQEG